MNEVVDCWIANPDNRKGGNANSARQRLQIPADRDCKSRPIERLRWLVVGLQILSDKRKCFPEVFSGRHYRVRIMGWNLIFKGREQGMGQCN